MRIGVTCWGLRMLMVVAALGWCGGGEVRAGGGDDGGGARSTGGGAGGREKRVMEVTAYCKCGDCNGYTRGSWKFLKLDRWNRYVNYGPHKGQRYTGKTASGGKLVEPRAGLVSRDTVQKPWKLPLRVLGAPLGAASARDGTIAADTDYYPFGTRMYVPGWGWGVVSDRGGAIKGPDRIDIFYKSHRRANEWGRRRVEVTVERR
jgi:hypothetical protein